MTSADLFLRWLSERAEGSWDGVREVASWWFRDAGGPKRPWTLAEHLSDLGHLDVDWQTRRWSIAPPVLNYLPPSSMLAVVCGARTWALTQLMRKIVASRHGPDVDLQIIPQANGPAAWIMLGNRGEVAEVAKQMGVPFVDDAADTIAMRLPLMSSVIGLASNVLGGTDSIRVFDVNDLQFRATRDTRQAGLYQLAAAAGPRWVFAPVPGQYHDVDRATGIYSELARHSVPVLRYVRGDLWVPSWLPLPPVHRRCLTLCSGLLPRKDNMHLRYEAVPNLIADRIASSLGQSLITGAPSRRQGGQQRP